MINWLHDPITVSVNELFAEFAVITSVSSKADTAVWHPTTVVAPLGIFDLKLVVVGVMSPAVHWMSIEYAAVIVGSVVPSKSLPSPSMM